MSVVFQSDPGWVRERIGKVSASRVKDVLDVRKDGKPGAARMAYMAELVTEMAMDQAVDHVITGPMKRGLENEPAARSAYEARTGHLVDAAAWVPHPRIAMAGATPDGFVATESGIHLVEFKVPLPTTYTKWRLAGVVPEEHIPQLVWQCACTNAPFVDFCAYFPEAVDPRAQLFIRRFEPAESLIRETEERVEEFIAEVEKAFHSFVEAG